MQFGVIFNILGHICKNEKQNKKIKVGTHAGWGNPKCGVSERSDFIFFPPIAKGMLPIKYMWKTESQIQKC